MRRILVVEDNRTNQLLDSKVLANLGYGVQIANNGAEALDAHSVAVFDAILMDVQMPGIDGYETTAKIREREEGMGGPRTPIIGLSARAISGDREAGLASGMDDYVTKPVSIERLRTVLARWLPDVGDAAEAAEDNDAQAVGVAESSRVTPSVPVGPRD
jgi:two-component system, sensor histidine kinase and response regulator